MAVFRLRSWIAGAILICIVAAVLPRFLSTSTGAPLDDLVLKFNSTGQSKICIELAAALPDGVYTEQHPRYHRFRTSYWSIIATGDKPTCVVQPANADELATVVQNLRAGFDKKEDVSFAVRSGGHAGEKGFASIDNGVAIDMSLFDEITVSPQRTSAVIGVGARWRDVYAKLGGMGLAMVGGRAANVGVGGLVLGGKSSARHQLTY